MGAFPFSRGLAMDLGTANTVIYEEGRGLVLNEPSIVALDRETRRVLAVGREAKTYLGRTPLGLEVIRPLRSGVINDFSVTQEMIRHFLTQAGSKRGFFRPLTLIGVPNGITQVEKRAIVDAAEAAGVKKVYLVDELLAGAIGLNLPIAEPQASLILDVGGGTSEGAVISMGAVSVSRSLRIAGDAANESIARHIQKKYQVVIGENMAENVKMTLGSAMPLENLPKFFCRGKELASGIPAAVELSGDDVREALEEITVEFISMVKQLLNQTPPELASDLMRHGLNLTGGGSLLKGLSERLSEETGLSVHCPDGPLLTVALGLGQILENMKYFRNVFVN